MEFVGFVGIISFRIGEIHVMIRFSISSNLVSRISETGCERKRLIHYESWRVVGLFEESIIISPKIIFRGNISIFSLSTVDETGIFDIMRCDLGVDLTMNI